MKLKTFKRIKAVMKECARMTDGTEFIITIKIQEEKHLIIRRLKPLMASSKPCFIFLLWNVAIQPHALLIVM